MLWHIANAVEHWQRLLAMDIMMVDFCTDLLLTGAHMAVVVGTVIWHPTPLLTSFGSPAPLHHVQVSSPGTLRVGHCTSCLPYPGKLHGFR
jgi:hypothetical protein